jgi:hypothetical protein
MITAMIRCTVFSYMLIEAVYVLIDKWKDRSIIVRDRSIRQTNPKRTFEVVVFRTSHSLRVPTSTKSRTCIRESLPWDLIIRCTQLKNDYCGMTVINPVRLLKSSLDVYVKRFISLSLRKIFWRFKRNEHSLFKNTQILSVMKGQNCEKPMLDKLLSSQKFCKNSPHNVR